MQDSNSVVAFINGTIEVSRTHFESHLNLICILSFPLMSESIRLLVQASRTTRFSSFAQAVIEFTAKVNNLGEERVDMKGFFFE